MVILPFNFVAIKYPGYFWNTVEKKLYTIKSGVLRELKKSQPNRYNHWRAGYQVSHQGRTRFLELRSLMILQPADSQIPVAKRFPAAS